MLQINTKIKNMGSYTIQFINCVAQQKDGEHGLSHLVEHCMCQPIKKYEKKFRQNGISWNAQTNQNQIIFYMNGLCKNIKKFINDYTYDILNYQITPEVFERQRNIVIAQYKMYYSEESQRFKLNWLRAHYNTTEIIGLLSDLENITYQKFMQFKKRITKSVKNTYYFTNKNSKKFEYNEKTNNSIHYDSNQIQSVDNTFTEQKQTKYPFEKYTTGQSKQCLIYLWHKIDYKDNQYKQLALSRLMNDYLVGGLTSYLYQEIRQKLGCVYCIYPEICSFVKEGYINFILQTDQNHKQIVIDQINKVIPKLIKKLSQREFNSIYKARITKQKICYNTNYTNYQIYTNEKVIEVNKYLDSKVITYEQFKQYVEQFTKQYKIFTDKDY